MDDTFLVAVKNSAEDLAFDSIELGDLPIRSEKFILGFAWYAGYPNDSLIYSVYAGE